MPDDVELITVEQLQAAKEALAKVNAGSEERPMSLTQFARVADALAEAAKTVGGLEHLARCIRALVELSHGGDKKEEK